VIDAQAGDFPSAINSASAGCALRTLQVLDAHADQIGDVEKRR
jgi:hypothetical protein